MQQRTCEGTQLKYIYLLALLALAGLSFAYFSCNAHPQRLGIVNGSFYSCAETVHCLSSQSSVADQHIDPLAIPYGANPAHALSAVIARIPKTRIVTETNNYMHVEFRSGWLALIDDFEFYYPENAQYIEVRAVPRCNYFDFSKNRDRIETLRKMLKEDARAP